MSHSLIVRFILAGIVPLLVACAVLFLQQRASSSTQAQNSARAHANGAAADLGREFQSWRTELLVAANNPALTEWFTAPASRGVLRGQLDGLLLQLNSLNRSLIDEACYISAAGPELGRQVKGEAAPPSDLSPDESGNPFFRATLALGPGQVHQNAPYISPDSHRWVISNSTPILVGGRKVALLHFESNLDAIRARLSAAATSGVVLRVIDTRTGRTIADSRSHRPILAQRLISARTDRLPDGWRTSRTAIPVSIGDDNHWLVEAAVRPAAALNGGLLLRLGGLILLVCAALVVIARRSARTFVTPLQRISALAEALAAGERGQRADTTGHVEVVQLATAFNSMADSLTEHEEQKARAQQEREEQLAANLEKERAAEQLLRQRSQAAIDETAGSVSAELHELTTRMQVVRAGAATIDERVTAIVSVMESAVARARCADEQVEQLHASLRDVEGMTQLIASVAAQTKLLALNATIEAARAGEAGRGFTVVAAEVKDLAIATARSTEQIAATLGRLTAHSSAVAESIDELSNAITDFGEAAEVLRGVATEQFGVVATLTAQVEDTRNRVESMTS